MKRTEKNRGAAMIIVLCVMVVFLALSTTIILAGSVAMNTARNNVVYERGKVQASSLSELFVGDLVGRDITDESSSLMRYVRNGIVSDDGSIGTSWPAYDVKKERDEQAEGAVRTFTMDTGTEGEEGAELHQISIEMYWTQNNDKIDWDTVTEETLANDSTLGSDCIHLFVDVISTLNDIRYHVKREFRADVSSNTDDSTKAEYPCKWSWSAIGRSPDRGKDGGA